MTAANKSFFPAVDRHLAHARHVIDSLELTPDARANLTAKAESVSERLSHEGLRLAVVGEASSGKSTFINALLREKLLESRATTMTTAAATRIEQGPHLGARVLLSRNPTTKSTPHPPAEVAIDLDGAKINLAEAFDVGASEVPEAASLSEAIRFVSSHETVALRVEEIVVTHPARFLSEGVCVVDTPGTNTTNPRHGEVTRRELQRCDLAIILIPSGQAVSSSMARFLKDEVSIRRMIHRCLFLLTAMDEIRPDERAAVQAGTAARLSRKLDLETSPTLFSIAARCVTEPTLRQERCTEEAWAKRFEATEAELRRRLLLQRKLIIGERLLGLMEGLFSELHERIVELRSACRDRQDIIASTLIPDWTDFAAKHRGDAKTQLRHAADATLAKADSLMREQQRQTLSHLRLRIMAQDSPSALQSFARNELPGALEEHAKVELEPFWQPLRHQAERVQSAFDNSLQATYERIVPLDRARHGGAKARRLDTLKPGLVAGLRDSAELAVPSTEDRFRIGGVVALVLLPFTGGLGALLTGFAISQIDRIIGPSIEERRNRFWEETESAVRKGFSETGRELHRAIEGYADRLRGDLDKRIDRHRKQYATTIDTWRREQREEIARLSVEQGRLEEEMKALERRLGTVRGHLTRLRAADDGIPVDQLEDA